MATLLFGIQALIVGQGVAADPEPPGWFAGDPHVHRSCGGPPESVASLKSKMSSNNLAVISLLADMGNGEVQDPATDLPLVDGQDDPSSAAGRLLHWDAEWHWDATYGQYAHQALGGHIVALGLSEAQQTWEEYTYPILDWVRQQGGVAGFAHMQYLDDGIPQGLDCCKPLEYPVEVALGAADFISEDVAGSDSVIKAYYRLLNTGFRPGLAAGTDYPCEVSGLGKLLTYVNVAKIADGQMTYQNWIKGIDQGRTVVSRNGHKEFLDLTVQGTKSPGDEIFLTGGGNVQVNIKWTANQKIRGRIELVHNGVVVANKQATATASAPVTLTATVAFPQSGWLAARRMDSGGHKVHTGAVFVTVDNAPVRASASDAQFYVQWIDNLLEKTSPGGEWGSYFVESRDAAHARYRDARARFQQIADGGVVPPATGEQTILTSQLPTLFENDSDYELGTKFRADVPGTITKVRLYTHASEGGVHIVRIWRVQDQSILAGPHEWDITAGTEGWKVFNLPAPVNISANTDYIVSVSNSMDRYYAEQPGGFAAPIVSGNLHTYVGSGVWSNILGQMPTSTWDNTNYFRDIVFCSSAGC